MTLAEHAAAFEGHETVRDIYVLDTTIDDWQRLVDFLRTSHHRLEFRIGDQSKPLPLDVARILARYDESDVENVGLGVDLGGYQVCTGFWDAESIEFTVFPEDINTEQRYQALMAFLIQLATVTGKPAILTDETSNPPEIPPWFIANPGDTRPTFRP